MDDVLHPVQEQWPLVAGIEKPLHAQDVLPARLQEHRQPDAERRPVDLLVENQAERMHMLQVIGLAQVELANIALLAAKQDVWRDFPVHNTQERRGRIDLFEPALELVDLFAVGDVRFW